MLVTDEHGQMLERMIAVVLDASRTEDQESTEKQKAGSGEPRAGSGEGRGSSGRGHRPLTTDHSPLDTGGIPSFCHSVNMAADGPGGRPLQELRFVVSFRDASTICRHVPAAQYLTWMGKLRELLISVNVPSLVDQISTCQWGLVTNWGTCMFTAK